MSNTTIVAVTNSYNDTVTLLPPKAYIEGVGEVTFHNNPRLEFDGTTNVTNFDNHIDFRITKNKLHSELMGNNYHHYPRLKRRTQYLNVFKFNQGRSPEECITIPHYYMATLREGEHVAITNFGIPKCDKVVIKEQLGARGSNQVVVPTNMLTTLLKHAKGKTLGEVKDMFPDLIYTDNSNWDMMFFDDPNDLFISELIGNVKSEYRLLVGGDTIYGRERTIKQGPYPQANLDTDKFHTVQDVVYDTIDNMFDETLVKTLYAFAKFIDLPIGSIDLYSTTDGNWGIFEYSTQFAFHGANPNFIKQLLLDGVKQVLTRQTKEVISNPKPETLRGIVRAPHSAIGNHVHGNVKSGFERLNDQLKTGGLKRGENVVIVGQVDGYKSAMSLLPDDKPLIEGVGMLLLMFAGKYRQFIELMVRNHKDRNLLSPTPTDHTLKSISFDNRKDHMWSYTFHANHMSLVICAEPGVPMVLTHQGYEIHDFLDACSNNIDTDDVKQLKDIIDELKPIYHLIANLHKERAVAHSVIDRSTPTLINFVHTQFSTVYSNLLGLLASHGKLEQDSQRDVKNHVTGITAVSKSGFDWCYDVHARDMSLILQASSIEDESPVMLINVSVNFETWLENRSKELSDEIKAELNKLLDAMYVSLHQLDFLNSKTDTPLRRDTKDTVFKKYCESIVSTELDEFTVEYHTLATLIATGVNGVDTLPTVVIVEWEMFNKDSYLQINAGTLSGNVGLNRNDLFSIWLAKHEMTLMDYIVNNHNQLGSESKRKAIEMCNQLTVKIKRLFDLKNIVE